MSSLSPLKCLGGVRQFLDTVYRRQIGLRPVVPVEVVQTDHERWQHLQRINKDL